MCCSLVDLYGCFLCLCSHLESLCVFGCVCCRFVFLFDSFAFVWRSNVHLIQSPLREQVSDRPVRPSGPAPSGLFRRTISCALILCSSAHSMCSAFVINFLCFSFLTNNICCPGDFSSCSKRTPAAWKTAFHAEVENPALEPEAVGGWWWPRCNSVILEMCVCVCKGTGCNFY